MKRILYILSLLLFITACDDGNLTVDPVDFSEGAVLKCNLKDVYYKVKGSEMMYIEIPASYFPSDQTLLNTPIQVPLSSTIRVIYRRYADETSANNICPQVPDATPNLVEQWIATDGTIEINSTAVKTTNSTTGFTKITGYIYNITFKNITFNKPSGPQIQTSVPFGNYSNTISTLAFGFDAEADKSTCSVSDNRVFNFSGSEALIFDSSNFSTLFANVATAPSDPRKALISSANKLTYKLFSNTINNAYFCATTVPSTPTLSQEWNAADGVDLTSGIIEVTTTQQGTNAFYHTIHLKKVVMKKGNSEFTLGDDYVFGSFTTTQ